MDADIFRWVCSSVSLTSITCLKTSSVPEIWILDTPSSDSTIDAVSDISSLDKTCFRSRSAAGELRRLLSSSSAIWIEKKISTYY